MANLKTSEETLASSLDGDEDIRITKSGVSMRAKSSQIISNGKQYISGRMYSNSPITHPLTTQVLANGLLRASAFRVYDNLAFDLLEINVIIAVSGKVRFGIYQDSDGYPGALVSNSDAGEFDTSSTGFVQISVSPNVALTPGLYWLAWNSNAAATLRANQYAESVIGSSAGVTGEGIAWSVNQAYGALPSSFPVGGTVVTAQSIGVPRLTMRAV